MCGMLECVGPSNTSVPPAARGVAWVSVQQRRLQLGELEGPGAIERAGPRGNHPAMSKTAENEGCTPNLDNDTCNVE